MRRPRGSYIGGHSIVTVRQDGTSWGLWTEPITKVRNAPKKWSRTPLQLSKIHILNVLYADKIGIKPPEPSEQIRVEIEAAGGFIEWCQIDGRRRDWFEKARDRIRKGKRPPSLPWPKSDSVT
jgi:hypothetical protein